MLVTRLRWLVVAGLAAPFLIACPDPGRGSAPSRLAEHVGRATCAECHAVEARSWEGSHHDLAMQPATESTVLANFHDAEFRYAGKTSTFFRRDGKFMVRTDGPDGQLTDYEIAYTFGADPLQQYLIELHDGRLQVLDICWDTRPTSDGGQRWFHLHPGEEVDHRDVLHWTGELQNWNYMCAECHSTNLRKNYDASEERYATTWSEIDVSCEACHGAGSLHVEWALETERGAARNDPDKGLEVVLGDRDQGAWRFDDGATTARREPSRQTRIEVETCARCHSRRTQLTDDYRHGRPIADTHLVTLLDEGLYHADGQILDEVYVYGSFLQSKMYANRVTCTDCHDPHTARLRHEGNATCGPCHKQAVFDTADHHHHPPESSGASCVGCHMAERDYMVIDPRHDHGFRVPRPDLSMKLATPNTCTDCHVDRTAEWAQAAVVEWYGTRRSDEPHWAEAIQAGRDRLAPAGPRLIAAIADGDTPPIVRATALELLRRYPSSHAAAVVGGSLRDDDPLVRRAATQALDLLDPDTRVRLGLAGLNDPVRTVRMEAARVLSSVRDRLTEAQRVAVQRGLDEYAQAQRFNADRAEGRLNLGWAQLQRGDLAEAEKAFLSARKSAPVMPAATINLTDLYRMQGRESEGEALLREALVAAPDNADLYHALGLLLVRQKQQAAGTEQLARAHALAPDRPQYAYVYGVALHSTGRTAEAIEVLARAHERHPAHAEILFALAAVLRDAGDRESAVLYARRLAETIPGHPGALGLLRELDRPAQ